MFGCDLKAKRIFKACDCYSPCGAREKHKYPPSIGANFKRRTGRLFSACTKNPRDRWKITHHPAAPRA